MMIRIAAVDDEPHVLERFERMVSEIKELELCGLFETGEQLLAYLKGNLLDAVFIDIEMPGMNGLQLSERILNLQAEINIVFVTAFNQYAVEAFEACALDYILKPLTETRLSKTISRLRKLQKAVPRSGKPFIQCIGDFEVFLGGEALPWKNSKAKEILAFLVHKKGVPVNWEKIADAVWPDYDSEKAQTNFHATTYLLRKRLAEAGIPQIIESGRGNYRIVTDQVDCDLYQLEARLKDKQMKRSGDIGLIELFMKRGYLDDSGYDWSHPRAAELEAMCRQAVAVHEMNKQQQKR